MDNSDGVKGLPGKGVAFWNKISSENTPSWEEILKLYTINYGLSQGIYEFQKNYRLLHLLENNEDFMREVKETPLTPRFNRVEKVQPQEEEILF